jgi:hypothetical protein
MVVQPRVGRMCWCWGSTKGSGLGMRGGRVTADMCCCFGSSTGLGFVLFFERKREMMLDIEKPCCEELEGSTMAMMNGNLLTKCCRVICNFRFW